MSNEHQKSQVELAVFEDFVRFSGLPFDLSTVEKRVPPEPDLLCQLGEEGKVAFELVELCDPNLAKAFSDPAPDDGGVQYIRTADPSFRIVRGKLRKSYETPHPVELLCYTAGRIITPPDVILPTIAPMLGLFRHTFRRAWLLANNRVHELWS